MLCTMCQFGTTKHWACKCGDIHCIHVGKCGLCEQTHSQAMEETTMTDLTVEQVDEQVFSLIPERDGHLTFNALVSRWRELNDWEHDRSTGESTVWESVKRLERQQRRIRCFTYPDQPLLFQRV
jgi:hypothetical protein